MKPPFLDSESLLMTGGFISRLESKERECLCELLLPPGVYSPKILLFHLHARIGSVKNKFVTFLGDSSLSFLVSSVPALDSISSSVLTREWIRESLRSCLSEEELNVRDHKPGHKRRFLRDPVSR